ncbi:hypothetical protein JNUCC74_07380 [Cerasibacillus sp. JNUCC 74]
MAKGIKRVLTITVVRKDIYKVFKQQQEFSFRHVNPIEGNLAVCAVALKNMEIIAEENLSEREALYGEKLLGVTRTV